LLILFCSMLNEKQRRLYAGLESLKLGYGLTSSSTRYVLNGTTQFARIK
jgi:hypothetical protein